MGVDPKRVMAELLGKVTGLQRNGWFHAYFLQRAPLLWWSIVGGQIPVGAGLALQINILKQTQIDLGDGAARQGSLHEAFNMAMLWKLPVVLSLKITVSDGNFCRKLLWIYGNWD
jgi:pyruvate dehydrogenase E1 component alpha subunit